MNLLALLFFTFILSNSKCSGQELELVYIDSTLFSDSNLILHFQNLNTDDTIKVLSSKILMDDDIIISKLFIGNRYTFKLTRFTYRTTNSKPRFNFNRPSYVYVENKMILNVNESYYYSKNLKNVFIIAPK
jgi:hypothetical protein